MSNEFKLPDIGEGLAEGEIVKWLVSEGDRVEEDQPLVEVMTDKATVEIPSPRAGRIAELRAAEGEVVEIGTTILIFGEDGAAPSTSNEEGASSTESAASGDGGAGREEDQVAEARERARAERDAAESEGEGAAGGPVLATPATRKLARELEVELDRVPGSGKDGRVTKEDVRAFAEGELEARTTPAAEPEQAAEAPAGEEVGAPEETAEAEAPAAAEETRAPAASAGPEVEVETEGEEDERIPLRGLRRTIAERMAEAKRTAAHFTYVEEVDMTEVVALREEAKPLAEEQGLKLTYLPFIVRALVIALKKHPHLNASLDEEAGELVLKKYYNIGIAVDTERGLMVPVVKGADRLGVFQLAGEIERLAGAARDGSIGVEDLRGGTFTVTSTGNIGGVLATPILNLPEVGILGVTAIRKRPVVRDDEIVVRQMMNLSLSLDHRVVDGAVGARFVRDLVKLLGDPKLQLLGTL